MKADPVGDFFLTVELDLSAIPLSRPMLPYTLAHHCRGGVGRLWPGTVRDTHIHTPQCRFCNLPSPPLRPSFCREKEGELSLLK